MADLPEERTLRAEIERSFRDLRDLASDIGAEGFKDGGWFARLLHHALDRYRERVDAAYFREKYPSLPPDAIAAQRISLAQKYATIAGGMNAAAYSGAVAATIGSGGGASPVALPAGIASFAVDLMYLTALQLTLAYDLSVIYDHPVDLDDPEDLYDLIRVAFGVKAGEALRNSAAKMGPELVRVGVKRVATGSTLHWLKALPVVGKYLLQRNIVKFAIPLVNVPLSGAMNWWFTGRIGDQARHIFRQRAANLEAAHGLSASEAGEIPTALLRVLYLVAQADGTMTREEALLLQHVADLMVKADAAVAEEVVAFRSQVEIDEEAVLAEVAALPEAQARAIVEAAKVAAGADGHVHRREKRVIGRLEGVVGR